jgi:hypothetical protein
MVKNYLFFVSTYNLEKKNKEINVIYVPILINIIHKRCIVYKKVYCIHILEVNCRIRINL